MPIPSSPSPAHIAGVILAGGQSRRMGGEPKGLRLLAGQPMIAHVIARIAPQLGPLAINANAPGYEGFGLPILPDSLPDFPGPLAGILTALDWAAGQAGITHLVTVATDTPFLPRDLVARLAGAAAGSRPALAASETGLHPVIGLWPVDLARDLRQWLAQEETRKVQAWTRRLTPAEVHFDPDAAAAPDPFFNANRPEDLVLAEDWLRGAGA